MGRMQAIPGKGIASSSLPYKRSPPSWLMKTVTPADVEQHCCKLAKKGLTPSQIGVILRGLLNETDYIEVQHGVSAPMWTML